MNETAARGRATAGRRQEYLARSRVVRSGRTPRPVRSLLRTTVPHSSRLVSHVYWRNCLSSMYDSPSFCRLGGKEREDLPDELTN